MSNSQASPDSTAPLPESLSKKGPHGAASAEVAQQLSLASALQPEAIVPPHSQDSLADLFGIPPEEVSIGAVQIPWDNATALFDT